VSNNLLLKREGSRKRLHARKELPRKGNEVSLIITTKRFIVLDEHAERLEAEERQKKKVEEKKARAEASRKSSEERAKAIMRKAQETRSSVFVAARKGESKKVKRGIWEESVDPTGGEVKSGCEQFIKHLPTDPQEALLHIAAKNGDVQLVQWLDSHSMYAFSLR